MYLGGDSGGKLVNSTGKETIELGSSFLNSEAICLIIESLITTAIGDEKLRIEPGDVGIGLVQFNAQHNRAAFASGERSLLFALSQHFIIWLFPECSGMPASTPPARAKTTNKVVSHLFICRFTIFN